MIVEKCPLPVLDPEKQTINNTLLSFAPTLSSEQLALHSVTLVEAPYEPVLSCDLALGQRTFRVLITLTSLQSWLSLTGYSLAIAKLPEPLLEALIEKLLATFQGDFKQRFGDFLVLKKISLEDDFPMLNKQHWCEFKLQLTEQLTCFVALSLSQIEALKPHFQVQRKASKGIFPLKVGISLGETALTQQEYLGLTTGDVVFFKQCYFAKNQQIRIDIQGHAAWQAQLDEQHITIEQPWSNVMKDDALIESNEVFDLNTVRVELDFTLPSLSLPLPEVQSLQPGYVFESQCNPDAPIAIKVNQQVVAHGELVKVGDKLGVRVLDLAGK